MVWFSPWTQMLCVNDVLDKQVHCLLPQLHVPPPPPTTHRGRQVHGCCPVSCCLPFLLQSFDLWGSAGAVADQPAAATAHLVSRESKSLSVDCEGDAQEHPVSLPTPGAGGKPTKSWARSTPTAHCLRHHGLLLLAELHPWLPVTRGWGSIPTATACRCCCGCRSCVVVSVAVCACCGCWCSCAAAAALPCMQVAGATISACHASTEQHNETLLPRPAHCEAAAPQTPQHLVVQHWVTPPAGVCASWSSCGGWIRTMRSSRLREGRGTVGAGNSSIQRSAYVVCYRLLGKKRAGSSSSSSWINRSTCHSTQFIFLDCPLHTKHPQCLFNATKDPKAPVPSGYNRADSLSFTPVPPPRMHATHTSNSNAVALGHNALALDSRQLDPDG